MKRLLTTILFFAVALSNSSCSKDEAPVEKPKPTCAPQEVKCQGNDIVMCNEDGTEWVTGETCEDGCAEGKCAEPKCDPDCGGKVCGDDGCGGSCGQCEAPELCEESQCVCKPECNEKACGDDGCGGQCGLCESLELCQTGQCVCEGECLAWKAVSDAIAAEESDAQLIATIETLNSYLLKFPEGKFIEDAKERLEQLEFNGLDQGKPKDLRAYLARYPNGVHGKETLAMLCDALYEAAERFGHILVLKEFVESCEGHSQAPVAKSKLAIWTELQGHLWAKEDTGTSKRKKKRGKKKRKKKTMLEKRVDFYKERLAANPEDPILADDFRSSLLREAGYYSKSPGAAGYFALAENFPEDEATKQIRDKIASGRRILIKDAAKCRGIDKFNRALCDSRKSLYLVIIYGLVGEQFDDSGDIQWMFNDDGDNGRLIKEYGVEGKMVFKISKFTKVRVSEYYSTIEPAELSLQFESSPGKDVKTNYDEGMTVNVLGKRGKDMKRAIIALPPFKFL